MVDETKDLKSCPFCGGRAAVHCVDNGNTTICCEYCGACIEERFHDHAIQEWNRRTGSKPLRNPHGILVTRNCELKSGATEALSKFMKLVDKDEHPSIVYFETIPGLGCSPEDAEIEYYSLTAGRSVVLGRDPILEAAERGDIKMRVVEPDVPHVCCWCESSVHDVVFADIGSTFGNAPYCSVECVHKHHAYLKTHPGNRSTVTVEDLTDDGND